MSLSAQLAQFDAAFAQMSDLASAIIGSEDITISGAPYDAPVTVKADWVLSGRAEKLTLHGRQVSYRVKIVIARDLLDVSPRQGQTVTRAKDGSVYRIVGELVNTESDASYHLVLDTIHK